MQTQAEFAQAPAQAQALATLRPIRLWTCRAWMQRNKLSLLAANPPLARCRSLPRCRCGGTDTLDAGGWVLPGSCQESHCWPGLTLRRWAGTARTPCAVAAASPAGPGTRSMNAVDGAQRRGGTTLYYGAGRVANRPVRQWWSTWWTRVRSQAGGAEPARVPSYLAFQSGALVGAAGVRGCCHHQPLHLRLDVDPAGSHGSPPCQHLSQGARPAHGGPGFIPTTPRRTGPALTDRPATRPPQNRCTPAHGTGPRQRAENLEWRCLRLFSVLALEYSGVDAINPE